MNKIILIFLSLAFTTVVSGQIIKSVGIKSGLSIANQTWRYKTIDLTLKKNYRKGFYSAVTLDFFKSKFFNLTTDIGYCQKGNTEKMLKTTTNMPEGDGTYITYDTKFNYLLLSPLIKLKYETNHITPYALLGLRLDYQVSYKSDINYSRIENDFHKSIYGLTCGAGVEYKFKSIGINSEFQYHYDFSKVLNIDQTSNSTGLEVNNKAFIICIGLKYYFIKNENKK